ncbi:YybH family protein [Shewanella sp. A14]
MKKKLSLLNTSWLTLLLLAVSLCVSSLNISAAPIPHKSLNTRYTDLTHAVEQLDLAAIEKIYTQDAIYISETQDKGIVSGKENILRLYSHFFNRIKRKNAKLEVDFRVLMRHSEGNNTTDIGYYLVRFHPGKESGEPVSEFAGKFVTVFNKEDQHKWKISVDSNTHAAPKFYYDAKPVPNLYYGRQFITPPTELNQHP